MLLRLQQRQTVDSSLNSVRILLNQHYPTVASVIEESPTTEQTTSEEDTEEQKETIDRTETKEEESARDESSSSELAAVTVHQAASQTLDFLQPFLDELHSEHLSKVRTWQYWLPQ